MKTLMNFLKFFAKLVFAVACFCIVISLVFFLIGLLTGSDLTLLEIVTFSVVNGILNGVFWGTIAVTFLCGLYYYKSARVKRANRKIIAKAQN